MKDYLFVAIVGGFCPAVLCAVTGLFTLASKGGARRFGRWLSLTAALYFSAASLLTLYHITTWKGGPGDGAGLLFIWLFIGVCGLGALACWALVLKTPGGDA